MDQVCFCFGFASRFIHAKGANTALDMHSLTVSARDRASKSASQALFDAQTAQAKLWMHTFSTKVCKVALQGGSSALRTVRALTVSPDRLYIAIAEDDGSTNVAEPDHTQVGPLSERV